MEILQYSTFEKIPEKLSTTQVAEQAAINGETAARRAKTSSSVNGALSSSKLLIPTTGNYQFSGIYKEGIPFEGEWLRLEGITFRGRQLQDHPDYPKAQFIGEITLGNRRTTATGLFDEQLNFLDGYHSTKIPPHMEFDPILIAQTEQAEHVTSDTRLWAKTDFAGKGENEDAYYLNPNFSAVIDGVSNAAETSFFVQDLLNNLHDTVTNSPNLSLKEIFAILCDRSTIVGGGATLAIARQQKDGVEIAYVGDPSIKVIDPITGQYLYLSAPDNVLSNAIQNYANGEIDTLIKLILTGIFYESTKTYKKAVAPGYYRFQKQSKDKNTLPDFLEKIFTEFGAEGLHYQLACGVLNGMVSKNKKFLHIHEEKIPFPRHGQLLFIKASDAIDNVVTNFEQLRFINKLGMTEGLAAIHDLAMDRSERYNDYCETPKLEMENGKIMVANGFCGPDHTTLIGHWFSEKK